MQFSLLNGDKQTGVSLIRMVEQLDAGPNLLQVKYPIPPATTIVELEQALCALGIGLLQQALKDLKKLTPKEQNNTQASYTRKLNKQDCRLNWSEDALSNYRRWQAFTPKPGVYTFWQQRRVLLKEISLDHAEPNSNKEQGQLSITPEKHLRVTCSFGAIVVYVLQWEGKKAVSAAAFLNGLQDRAKFLSLGFS